MMKAEPALPSTTQMASTDDSQYDNPPPPAYSGPSTSSTTAAPSVVHTSQCRDPLFAVLFLLQLLAVLVIGWYCYGHDAGSSFANNGNASGSASLATGQTYGSWMILAIDIGIALIASYLVLFLTKAQPKLMIWLSLIYMLVMSLFGLILAARNGSATGVVFAVIAFALTAYFVYCVRNRIDFTARLLTVTIAFTEAFPSAYLVIMAGNALQVGWVWLFFFCAGSIVTSLNDYTGASQSLIYFVYFCLALSFYWTSEVIKNLTIVATSGIVATWYFLYPQNTPSQVALPAIGRACTYSLGSIAEGSLIVAVIKCVQLLLNLVIQQMQQQGDNIVAVCLVQVLNLLIGFFNGLLQYFNQYAYSRIGIYGDPYVPAAKATWDLFRTRGWDAIINDSLISAVMGLVEIMIATTCLIISALIAYYGLAAGNWQLLAGIGFIVGMSLARTVTALIEGSVITIFICLAEDPAAMARTKPELYALINEPIRSRFGIDLNAPKV